MSVTSTNIIVKQSSEIIGCSMDFTNWLTGGDTLLEVTTSIEPNDSTLGISSVSIDGNYIRMVASSGIAGYTYRVNSGIFGNSLRYIGTDEALGEISQKLDAVNKEINKLKDELI